MSDQSSSPLQYASQSQVDADVVTKTNDDDTARIKAAIANVLVLLIIIMISNFATNDSIDGKKNKSEILLFLFSLQKHDNSFMFNI